MNKVIIYVFYIFEEINNLRLSKTIEVRSYKSPSLPKLQLNDIYSIVIFMYVIKFRYIYIYIYI